MFLPISSPIRILCKTEYVERATESEREGEEALSNENERVLWVYGVCVRLIDKSREKTG